MSAVERRRGTKAGKTHQARPNPLGNSEITPARPMVSSSSELQRSRLVPMSQAGVSPESVEISYFDEVETGALVGA